MVHWTPTGIEPTDYDDKCRSPVALALCTCSWDEIVSIGRCSGFEQVAIAFGLTEHDSRQFTANGYNSEHITTRASGFFGRFTKAGLPTRRGRRGGSRKVRQIRVITSPRTDHPCHHQYHAQRSGHVPRPRHLISIPIETPLQKEASMGLPDASQPTGPLSYYAININSLAKPFAKEQPSAGLMAYKYY